MAQTLKKNRLNADHNIASTTRHNGRMGVDVQSALDRKLERMKRVTGFSQDLKVVWAPSSDPKEHGEVKGNVILIYDEEKKTALETLKHEFLHYSIHKEVVEPLIKYINLEKALIEDLIYRRVEDLVDRLSKLL
jgi:hypothetical protein